MKSFIDLFKIKKNNNKGIRENWKDRLSQCSPSMSMAKEWQQNIIKHNVYVRKVMAIKELNDVPFEVWNELLNCDEEKTRAVAEEFAVKVGTPEYTDDVKDDAMEFCINWYSRKHVSLFHTKEVSVSYLD